MGGVNISGRALKIPAPNDLKHNTKCFTPHAHSFTVHVPACRYKMDSGGQGWSEDKVDSVQVTTSCSYLVKLH